MTISAKTASPLDTTREAGPGNPLTVPNGSNDHSPEPIWQSEPSHRPFPSPAWPTSHPGPQVTPPLPGQHPHPLRTDQMVYACYDQERGMPCVSPPRSAVQTPQGRASLLDASVQEATAEGEALARWLDDGGTTSPSFRSTSVLKA